MSLYLFHMMDSGRLVMASDDMNRNESFSRFNLGWGPVPFHPEDSSRCHEDMETCYGMRPAFWSS